MTTPNPIYELPDLKCKSVCKNAGSAIPGSILACDQGSQDFCASTANITSDDCSEYLQRVSSTVYMTANGLSNRVMLPAVYPYMDSSNTYFIHLLNNLDSACSSSSNISSLGCQNAIKNLTPPQYTNDNPAIQNAYNSFFNIQKNWYQSYVENCYTYNPNCKSSDISIVGIENWVIAKKAAALISFSSNPPLFYTDPLYKKLYKIYPEYFTEIDTLMGTYINITNITDSSKRSNIINLAFSNQKIYNLLYDFIDKTKNNKDTFYGGTVVQFLLEIKDANLNNSSITTSIKSNASGKSIVSLINDSINTDINGLVTNIPFNKTLFDRLIFLQKNFINLFAGVTSVSSLKPDLYLTYCNNNQFDSGCVKTPPAEKTTDMIQRQVARYCITNPNDVNCAGVSPKLDGSEIWLKTNTKNTATVDSKNVLTGLISKCGASGELTSDECVQLCAKYPSICKDDTITKCSSAKYRYTSTKDTFITNTLDSDSLGSLDTDTLVDNPDDNKNAFSDSFDSDSFDSDSFDSDSFDSDYMHGYNHEDYKESRKHIQDHEHNYSFGADIILIILAFIVALLIYSLLCKKTKYATDRNTNDTTSSLNKT